MNRIQQFTLLFGIGSVLAVFPEYSSGQLFQSASVADTGLQPTSIVVGPDASSLIVTNFGGDAIERFPIDGQCQIGTPQSWPTGLGPLSIAIDRSNHLVYITYFSEDRLGVFSVESGTLEPVGQYPTGRGPVDVSITPDDNLIFVSNVFDGTVTAYERVNTDRLRPRAVTPTVSNPRSMAIDSTGEFLFVADEQDPVIATLKIETDGSIRSVSRYIMQGPAEDLLAHPSGPQLYVTQGQDNRILKLAIGSLGQLRQTAASSFEGIEERHDELGNLGRTAPFPGSMTLDPRNNRLFVTGRQTSDVHAYNVQGDESFESLGSYPVFEYPEDVALDLSSGCLYVISSAYGQILGMKAGP